MTMRSGLTAAFSLCLLATPSLGAETAPSVVVTIKPLHGLAAAVMEGVGEPYLILDETASPHGYSLRPSDARQLDEADLLVWVGPSMESFLVGSLDSLAADARLVTAMELSGMRLREAREGGIWEGHDHHHEDGDAHHVEHAKHEGNEEHEDEHEHEEENENEDEHEDEHEEHEENEGNEEHSAHDDPGGKDPHVWLDPRNAQVIAAAIAAALSEEDPSNADLYQRNLEALTASLDQLDRTLAESLGPVRAKPYIVFHDAYAYLEARYGLSPVGSITVSPDRSPGARRIAEMREVIEDRGAVCIFAEPQFSPALIESLTDGSEIGSGTLDPLGAAVQPGPAAYQEILQDLGDSLTECLAVAG